MFLARNDQRVVLITGATTGIGLALVRLLSRTELRLAVTARPSSLARFSGLDIQSSERLIILPLDVADPDQANRAYARVEERWGGVDVLVNNAAISYRAVMEHLTDEDELNQFRVNYLGPLHLTRLVLPVMRARRRGHIINLSSVGGMMAMPTMGGYSASKFALEGASEALWYELKPWGIHVTLIEPGFVHSNGIEHARWTEKSQRARSSPTQAYHPYYRHMVAFIRRMTARSRTTPDGVARTIYKVMYSRHPPLRRAGTRDAVFFDLLRRLLPKRLYHQILYRGLPGIDSWVDE